MEINRRAALAGAFALPALATAKMGVAAPLSSFVPLRPGEALVGMRVRNNRILYPGRRISIADYNREFGEQLEGHESILRDCHFSGVTGDRAI